MSEMSGRRAALDAALQAMPEVRSSAPLAVLPITSDQWQRSVGDAGLARWVGEYEARRTIVVAASSSRGADLARKLRPAALELAQAARDLCDCLEALASLAPGDESPRRVRSWRDAVAADAPAVVIAAIDEMVPPQVPVWPTLPSAIANSPDVLHELFGLSTDDLTDDAGAFCDARVLAHYRFRLPELHDRCEPILGLVADRSPSVFTAVSAARDLATSVSPYVTLRSARQIRARILVAFSADASRTKTVFAEAALELDKEWTSFVRLQDRLRRAEAAQTQRERAVSVLEAYKHMAEGISRRWVWLLLRLAGLDDSMPTVGKLGQPAAARLGELGARIESALVPAMRNAEAHEEFVFDEDTGLLVVESTGFHPDEILARLTDLDILQRALIVGRLAAFSDEPALSDDIPGSLAGPSASSAMMLARHRFGHAGQPIRSFVRDRDRLDIVIDRLRPEACNPCYLALTQAAQVLPTVSRFVVRVPNRDEAIIDVTAGVLHAN